ncbi:AAA family ATPase [Paracoccus sp. S-4012]|uniref:AAA family ATPase n=1 Tax=Paracoccus sp. S-4012 TaxID=2665648 RepID=UPI0012B073C3|nr:AAA family ATPase [Paracoccus sp. S-4012]MRX51642.1 AAA family ATPase [Paracoccus sp. S-4012]
MTMPHWTDLATEALARIRMAADGGAEPPDSPDWLEEADWIQPRQLAPLRTPSAGVSGDERRPGNALQGDAVRAANDHVRPAPPMPIDRVLVLLRLCAGLGSATRLDAIIQPHAVTVLDHGDIPQELVRELLVDGLLPEGVVTTSKNPLRPHAPGDGLNLFSLRTATERYYRGSTESQLTALLGRASPVLLLVTDPEDIAVELRSALPAAITVPPVNQEILRFLLGITRNGDDLPDDRDEFLRLLPADTDLGKLSAPALLLALREPSTEAVVERLRAMVSADELTDRKQARRPTLDDIEGLGEAERMARRMVADLLAWKAGEVAWSELQRSLLLFGPPGTGKSFLAAAMANSAGIALVRGSLAQWQAAGHLGRMLAAMRSTFREAQDSAPAVLVIDEIDSVGSRTSDDQHNEAYRRQVINAVLEEFDGLKQTEGVLVVGTCNAPETIDPALLRPGRMDAIVEVPLPGRAALARMMRDGYPGQISDSDLARLARAASGHTAAAIDGGLRGARAAARAERRPVRPDDVLEALGNRHEADASIYHRTAIHECGHAIVATALGVSRVMRVVLGPAGGETLSEPRPRSGLLREIEADLDRCMAGRAAERLVCGNISAGSGGPSNSDIAEATRIAASIDMRQGLGAEGPLWLGRNLDGYLESAERRARVRARIEQAEERACVVLQRNRALLEAMAEALTAAGSLEGEELETWTRQVDPGDGANPQE